MRRFCFLLVVLAGVLQRTAPAEDKDKMRLFNTFYLDGATVTYVLTMRQDRTFDLYSAAGGHVSGTFRPNDEFFSMTAGAVKRYFSYSFKSRNVKLGSREMDRTIKGDLLGEMPPLHESSGHALYVAEGEWRSKGRPLFNPQEAAAKPAAPVAGVQEPVIGNPRPANSPPAAAPQPPAAPSPSPASPPPPAAAAQPPGSCADLAGTYYPRGRKNECLVITANGCFAYVPPQGAAQNGALLRTDYEITFVGAASKRYFTLRLVPGGFELARRATDVTKPGDVLGGMPPQDREPASWLKEGAEQAAPAAPQAAPATSAPDVPRAQPAGVPVKSLQALVGKFVYKPSPFLAETLLVAEDGSFTYKDSAGANATGKLRFEDDVLVFASGEEVRRFTAVLEGPNLTLTRAKDDSPKSKNDLSSMSPTTLQTAKYEKK
ncbi:MAG: hypothetical protein ABSE73_13680 [Planctomycetota bacterium]